MYFQWADACTGWTTEQRLDLTLTFGEADPVTIGTNYTTWEAKDGKQFRFNMRVVTNGQTTEEYKGIATIPEPGKAGMAKFVVPEEKSVEIPPGTMFPTVHTQALLRQAERGGAPLFAATLFDGTKGDGLSEISAMIGRRQPTLPEGAKVGRANQPDVMWPVRMAFYEAKSQLPEPEYEMDSTLLPNGVTGSMVMDYGDYTVRMGLEKLETLPPTSCQP
jgi:hypothetical protein